MSCEFSLQLHAYHDNELPADAAERVRAHLETCMDCRSELGDLQRMSQLVAGTRVPDWTEGHQQRLWQRVHGGTDKGILRIAELMSAAAAVILLVGLAGLLYSQATSTEPVAWEKTAITLRDDTQGVNAEGPWATMMDNGVIDTGDNEQ